MHFTWRNDLGLETASSVTRARMNISIKFKRLHFSVVQLQVRTDTHWTDGQTNGLQCIMRPAIGRPVITGL